MHSFPLSSSLDASATVPRPQQFELARKGKSSKGGSLGDEFEGGGGGELVERQGVGCCGIITADGLKRVRDGEDGEVLELLEKGEDLAERVAETSQSECLHIAQSRQGRPPVLGAPHMVEADPLTDRRQAEELRGNGYDRVEIWRRTTGV